MFEWKPYVSAVERRRKAERHAASLKKRGHALSPVIASRGAIAKTFWGKSWCANLEGYSDYSNRLPRGRTYCRNGSVIDLKIAAGAVTAVVCGSTLYQIKMKISGVPKAHWYAIGKDCSGSVDSLVELLQGRLSQAVMERLCRKGMGLFPSPREIRFECSCPDWAAMCKHIAAVFYGIGARLDVEPELLFLLRNVDAKDLVARAAAGMPLPSGKSPKSAKLLDASILADVFGIEMAEFGAPSRAEAKIKPKAKKRMASGRRNVPICAKKAAKVRK
ncbi:MAG: hypothetical protein ABI356_10285 [Steroidobacteraceae bacterium]